MPNHCQFKTISDIIYTCKETKPNSTKDMLFSHIQSSLWLLSLPQTKAGCSVRPCTHLQTGNVPKRFEIKSPSSVHIWVTKCLFHAGKGTETQTSVEDIGAFPRAFLQPNVGSCWYSLEQVQPSEMCSISFWAQVFIKVSEGWCHGEAVHVAGCSEFI